MPRFASFAEDVTEQVDTLVVTLIDPGSDPGHLTRLIDMSLSALDEKPAVRFDVDPLMDYRASRPLLNFSKGRIVGMGREDMVISLSRDMSGQPFLRLHGLEPDFHWDSLVSDMFDIVDHFSLSSIYSFTAVGAPIPHTRPADMIVRTTVDNRHPALDADFWFPASFASYFEFHAGKIGLDMTNVAVRVPIYLAAHHYPAGAASALSMVSSMSGLSFPLGDLTRDGEEQKANLAAMMDENKELEGIISAFEKDYDMGAMTEGFVRAPQTELSVPTIEEIGRAAELFLEQVDSASAGPISAVSDSFDPQGLFSRIKRYREGQKREAGQVRQPGDTMTSLSDTSDKPRRKGKHSY